MSTKNVLDSVLLLLVASAMMFLWCRSDPRAPHRDESFLASLARCADQSDSDGLARSLAGVGLGLLGIAVEKVGNGFHFVPALKAEHVEILGESIG